MFVKYVRSATRCRRRVELLNRMMNCYIIRWKLAKWNLDRVKSYSFLENFALKTTVKDLHVDLLPCMSIFSPACRSSPKISVEAFHMILHQGGHFRQIYIGGKFVFVEHFA